MSTITTSIPPHTQQNGLVEYASRSPSYTTPLSSPSTKRRDTPLLDTSIAMTVTPASGTVSAASAKSPSASLSSLPRTMPDGAVDQSPTSWASPVTPHASQQPTPTDGVSPPVSYPAIGDAFGRPRPAGLIRRISRGAQNRLRRRPSTTQTNRLRDQSAGPVLVRRRSDSTGPTDLAGDMSDLELELPSEDGAEDNSSSILTSDSVSGLGISAGRKSNASTFEGGIAPTISAVLEQGTWLTKVTKKKRKSLKFRLDPLAAKVCWADSNPAKQFYIDDVGEIRVGAEARNSREDIQVPAEQEGCWMTIVYHVPERSKGRSIKTMHLIAESEFIVKLWVDALKAVERDRIEIMNALSANPEKSERSMRMAWRQAMARKRPEDEQKIAFDDAKWICRKLEINCSPDAIRMHFNESDHDLSHMLTYPQYEYFVNLFKVRKDVLAVYNMAKPSNELEMSSDSFLRFLKESQGIDVDKDRRSWEGKFDFFARNYSGRTLDTHAAASAPCSMNLQAFQNFLTSGLNNCLTATTSSETTLDRPLNEYFVSSSHNTYLLGRQVAGESSVEGYISALVKGCRCIEVDCWDGKNGRPVVNHGRTLSTEALFEDCISVIAKYAFTSSSYPLIVSLEVHCSPEQQAVMVDIMRRYFADALLTTPVMINSSTLPSPEELRHKILIKVKSQHQLDNGNFLSTRQARRATRPRSHSSPFISTAPLDGAVAPTTPPFESPDPRPSNTWSISRGSTASNGGLSASSSTSDSENATPSADGKKKRKTSHIIPVLGLLSVYTCGIKFSDFSVPEAKVYNHIYSLAEGVFVKTSRDTESKPQLEKHNQHYLMRVYPSARRIDSSNFNPLSAWRRGVQMAALNWQSYDVHMQVNDAMFAAGTDRTGYVLKPDELRHAKHLPIVDLLPDRQSRNQRKGMKLVKFSVEIISAQRLPRPRKHNPDVGMNPYVEFEMYSAEDKARGIARGEGGTDASARDGSSGIGSPLRKRTKIVEGNGFDPIFNQPITMTAETKYPSLMFVRWTVWNSPDGRNLSSNSTMLATFTAKLNSLQQGYRHLPLLNAYGERYRDAKLFVKIKKEAPIALHMDEGAYGINDQSTVSPRAENGRSERSWSRKIFSRSPSMRNKSRDQSPYGSLSRTSSMER